MTTDTTDLVAGISDALRDGSGAYFLGSGISAESGFPDWMGLIQPLVAQLGITLQADDDLTAMAQYVVNHHSGQRGPLIGAITRALRTSGTTNRYHKAIRQTNISTIWTTNFDTLIEDSLSSSNVVVRADGSDLLYAKPFDIEVLKVHGCLNKNPDKIVITSQDYEDFARSKEGMAERLRHDLVHRTFLFAGYKHRDPDIATVLVEARRLGRGLTQHHRMLLKRETEPEKALRQNLWISDLRRIGIDCVLVDNYDDVLKTMERIALRSRGNGTFVSGSHSEKSPMAEEIGTALAEMPGIVLIDGQSDGIGRQVANAFGTACVTNKIDIQNRIRVFPNPYSSNPGFANDASLLPDLKRLRKHLFRAVHTAVLFDGGMGTDAEFELAVEMGCRVVPVPASPNSPAAKYLENAAVGKFLEERCPNYLTKATSVVLKAKDVIECIKAACK